MKQEKLNKKKNFFHQGSFKMKEISSNQEYPKPNNKTEEIAG
jgi:hypothetical protein